MLRCVLDLATYVWSWCNIGLGTYAHGASEHAALPAVMARLPYVPAQLPVVHRHRDGVVRAQVTRVLEVESHF